MGKIIIEEMEFYAFHGHYKEEQIVGNRFLVDLEIEGDMSIPASSDRLGDAINYQVAYRLIREEMRKKKSNLLENIAKRILDALFDNLKGIERATVRVRKMNPPLGGPIKSIGVTLTREN
ncbi:MAG: dihydroneopterin aldolase [Bacteroidales bacterium]|nr:dihydroneopterin aldolase [Bacteroidales bacterium]MBN2698820.1 dihydroneopterin aldolase [Bacteroidales bacterium]